MYTDFVLLCWTTALESHPMFSFQESHQRRKHLIAAWENYMLRHIHDLGVTWSCHTQASAHKNVNTHIESACAAACHRIFIGNALSPAKLAQLKRSAHTPWSMYKKQTKTQSMLLQPKLDHNTRQMGTFPHIYHYHYSHTFLCIGFLNVCQVCAKVFTGLSQTFSILNIRRRRRGRQNGILGFKSTVRMGLRGQLMGYGFTYCGYKRKTSN